ncbi:MAG: hypothetical protein LZ173_05495 [Thaumarchaeota archaeon]|jgi:hypothetical protein|nr:hypothetical protein [Candidatus Geocrenenecus arthurdayi]
MRLPKFWEEASISSFEKTLEIWRELYILDDVFYEKIISELDFRNINPKKTYCYLLRFLELWGVRRTAVKVDPRKLSETITCLRPLLTDLNHNLIEVDLQTIEEKVIEVFNKISRVDNIGPTSSSKILHLLIPNLFIMWDREIAREFDVQMNSGGYVNFLKMCKSIYEKLSEKYKEQGVDNPTAYLLSKFKKPLTKLLDEYNWLYTRSWRDKIFEIAKKSVNDS